MAKPGEDAMAQRLRWMEENVDGAYHARHPKGHDEEGGYRTNSGTCILVSCYMEALGKVLMRGTSGPGRRFREFLQRCMGDLISEAKARGIADPPRWFYAEFRSAFVNGYPKPEFAWKRGGSGKYFLTDSKNRTILNIDEFVAGFKRGITQFKRCADTDPDLRSNFIRYITN
jgi:hypothetical protein